VAVLLLLLVCSLGAALRLPWLDIGLALPAVGGLSLLILVFRWDEAVGAWRQQRHVAVAAVTTWVWLAVAAAASPLPFVAWEAWVKVAIFGLAGLAMIAACSERAGRRLVVDVVLAFLVVLAVFGIVEAVWPENLLLRLLRSEASLSITPRVASLLPWPNQFGVLMVFALVLLEVRRPEMAPRSLAWLLRVLFVSQVAQSGSRNAWLVLAATAIALVATRITPPRRGATLVLVFVAIGLTLPVPARQAGLRRGSWLPPANRIIHEPRGWSPSLSPAGQSLSLRSKLWRAAGATVAERPVVGIGPGVFQATVGFGVMGREGFNTHNLVLEVAVSGGVVAVVLMGVTALILVARSPRPRGRQMAPLAVLVAGQVLDCFFHDPTFDVMLAVAVALLITHGGDP
jgi:O-antigen ligase